MWDRVGGVAAGRDADVHQLADRRFAVCRIDVSRRTEITRDEPGERVATLRVRQASETLRRDERDVEANTVRLEVIRHCPARNASDRNRERPGECTRWDNHRETCLSKIDRAADSAVDG